VYVQNFLGGILKRLDHPASAIKSIVILTAYTITQSSENTAFLV
jgi:hypothetical protein